MQHIKKFILKHKHLYWLLLFIPFQAWFECCEKSLVPKYIMHTSLDDKIPFIKQFIIPYIVWFAYVGFGLVYTGVTSKQDFYKLFVFLMGGMATCYILYMCFPNGQDLRPEITQNDIFSKLVKFIYSTDTPTNVCPSIHVFNSIAVDSALRNSVSFNMKKGGKQISFITAITICFSILFVKQHSVIDFVCGSILGLIFYIPIYAIPNIKQYKLKYEDKEYRFSELLKIAINY